LIFASRVGIESDGSPWELSDLCSKRAFNENISVAWHASPSFVV
jgi:hypothetical protein